jgi:phenylpyruvate tautomerase PptA (4-oxalocrotonate tautomerase family)
MPLITIQSNASVDDAAVAPMLSVFSARLAELLGQPEAYVMTLYDRPAGMTMAATADPCCLVEVRSIVEFSSEQTRDVARAVCAMLEERLGVAPNRVFLNFTNFDPAMWGFNGATLG